jgi:SAM-dependent methyltransferase
MDPGTIEEMYALESHHWWFVGKRLLVDSLLEDVLRSPGLRILDVGCGTGGVLAHLRDRAHAVGQAVGIDQSRLALARCRQRGLFHLVCAEGGALPFAPASFDVILLLDVLEHSADERALLAGVRALLRPGGTLLVSVPAFQFLWSVHDEVLHHVRRYTARRLRRALADGGFTIRRVTYTNTLAFPPALIVRGLLPRLGLARGSGTDFRTPASWANRALVAAYQLEAKVLRYVPRLPMGVSVAALASVAGPAGSPPHLM